MQKTPLEKKVYGRLDELGISELMVWQNGDKGGRSAVIGTYRILMYRMSLDAEVEAAANARTKSAVESTRSFVADADSGVNSNESGSAASDHQQPHAEVSPSREIKFKHKLNFAILGNKKKKTKKRSRTCVIL